MITPTEGIRPHVAGIAGVPPAPRRRRAVFIEIVSRFALSAEDARDPSKGIESFIAAETDSDFLLRHLRIT
jgi:hypothetical protein